MIHRFYSSQRKSQDIKLSLKTSAWISCFGRRNSCATAATVSIQWCLYSKATVSIQCNTNITQKRIPRIPCDPPNHHGLSLDTWQPEMYFLTPQLCLFQKSTQLESSSLVFSDKLLSVGNMHLRFFHIILWPDCLFLFVANYDSAFCLLHNLFIHSCTEVW